MQDRPTYRPVYKAIHRPLTVCGVDRRLFFLALILGAATFNLFYSFLAGLLMFVGLYGFALWATRRDPDMLRILLASSKTRRDRVSASTRKAWPNQVSCDCSPQPNEERSARAAVMTMVPGPRSGGMKPPE